MNKDQDQTRFVFVTGGVLSGIGKEFKSRPDSPHPLYLGLIRAALEHKKQRGRA
ncbi:MAG: hypothetical protein ACW975_07605 [Candidatus Thorarchaeota archaeon]